MAAEYSSADSLRVYLTGAAEDGGVQAAQAMSLGGFRSATEVQGLGVRLMQPIRGLVVEFASGGNGAGRGILRVVDGNTLAWAPPGGEEGEPVEIGNGETRVVEGAEQGSYLRVRRRTSAALSGYCTVLLTEVHNNGAGMSDVEVGEGNYHRALMLRNVSGEMLRNVRVWVKSADGLRVGLEEPVDGAVQVIGSATTEPAGVTWSEGASLEEGLVIAELGAGENWGLWLQRPGVEGASAGVLNAVGWRFEVEREV